MADNDTAAPTDALAEGFPNRDTLTAAGIETYQDLADASDDDLLALEGIGKATVKTIRQASPTADEARAATGPAHELVWARVNRQSYHRNGNTYGRNARLQVPRYVLEDIAKRKENPPSLVAVEGAEE